MRPKLVQSAFTWRFFVLFCFLMILAIPLFSGCSQSPNEADVVDHSITSTDRAQEAVTLPNSKATQNSRFLQAKTTAQKDNANANANANANSNSSDSARVKLGNEVLLDNYRHLVTGKRVGLITNQTGINSQGENLIDILAADPEINLSALYAPEHGLDGKAAAGEYVESYTHETLEIPVYSLYGPTRQPTAEMLDEVDVLLYDMQDIGARTYTYISTLNYAMRAGAAHDTPVIILDRPNPLGGVQVEGPVLEAPFQSFVGIDKLPKAHGMTVGELGKFFNRHIEADLTVIPMNNYQRNMIFQDTGLPWVRTSPNIQTLDDAFKYMATGLGEGTGVRQADRFHWIGGKGLNAAKYAGKLNDAPLPGVKFFPEYKEDAGGARLEITDYYQFNPAKTGIYALATAFQLGDFNVPQSGDLDNPAEIVMFDKVMGTDQIGKWLSAGLSPDKIIDNYKLSLQAFKEKRAHYLMDEYAPEFLVKVSGKMIDFDVSPWLDANARLLVPVRAITEALGAQVQWEAADRTVTITRDQQEIVFTIDSPNVRKNSQLSTMDTHPVIRDGRAFIPLRYLGEYLGTEVQYDPDWRMVHVK